MKNVYLDMTAKDYDMPYWLVEKTYKEWDKKGLFYDKLEEILKDRSK